MADLKNNLTESAFLVLDSLNKSMAKDYQKLIINIDVKSAKNLIKADVFNDSDPYCKLTIGNLSFRTKAIHDDNNPTWNESIQFIVDYKFDDDIIELLVECYDHNDIKNDVFLGECKLNLGPNTNSVCVLKLKNTKKKGEVYLNISTQKVICYNEVENEKQKQCKNKLKTLQNKFMKYDVNYMNSFLKYVKVNKYLEIVEVELMDDWKNYFKGKAIMECKVDDSDGICGGNKGMCIDELCDNKYGNEMKIIGLDKGCIVVSINNVDVVNMEYKMILFYLKLMFNKNKSCNITFKC